MEFLETKRFNKHALIFVGLHTLFLATFAFDFFEFH